MSNTSRPANRLAASTSPYLLQHAHNPVDWFPWGPEALARARERDLPIFLSIGYSACHWCHVMERESFESERIARVLNEHFVPVKVDREERPDLDELYMTATQLMTGGGGWPMSVFLTPELKPFYAGTYFPPEDRWGRPGFESLLRELARAWSERRGACEEQAERVASAVRRVTQGEACRAGLTEETLEQSAAALLVTFDPDHGGFGSAPKFPPSMRLEFLLGRARDHGDRGARTALETTLDRMSRGGIYDHVGGGFHRYSVDERWLVPHFEKMLYDNALLARLYALAYAESGHWAWRKIACETFNYVLREMTSPEGGFYSATDADSEGEEGRYFVWTPEEVREALGEAEGSAFCDLYDIRPGGNFEGRSIPNLIRRPLDEIARDAGEAPEALDARLAKQRERLRLAREERVPPLLDDKILCAWNGLMIRAFVSGARVLDEPRYRSAAERAAGFILERMRDPTGRLLRSYRQGRASIPAFHNDYASLALALLELAAETGEERWRAEGLRLLDQADRLFRDPVTRACSLTPHDHEPLPSRVLELQDGAVPSSNSLAALAWIRAAEATGEDRCRARAAELLSLMAGSLPAHAAAYPNWLTAGAEYIRRWPEGVSLGADEGLGLEIHTSRDRIRPGGMLWIAARLAIPHGMHVYAAEPGADYLVPTRLMLELPRGLSAGDAVFPPGESWVDGSGAEPIRVYRDSVLMGVEIRADPACPVGRGELGLAVRIQLCDQDRCYAPREIRTAVPVEIGDEDGPVRHAELFGTLGVALG